MLLNTKVKSPAIQTETLERDDLDRALDTYHQKKVTLLSAPAGYGKTTLVVKFLKSHSLRYAWYSLDRSDDDVVTFWTYLIHALKRLDLSIGKKSLPLLNSQISGDKHRAIVQLVEDLDKFSSRYLSSEHAVIVLDDFQDIWNQELLEQINFFIEFIPDSIHLFITSRTVPPLQIAKRAARSELLYLMKEQLRLTPEQARDFIKGRMGEALSLDHINQIVDKAEGWLGALQILSTHDQFVASPYRRDTELDTGFIQNYIDDELLKNLDGNSLTILRQISPLSRFSLGMVSSIWGRDFSFEWFSNLKHLNLIFEMNGDDGSWYTIHGLVRDKLIQEYNLLQTNRSYLTEILDWLISQELWADAFEFSILTQSWSSASNVALPCLGDIVASGKLQLVYPLINRFPEAQLSKMPKLSLYKIWADYQSRGHDFAKVRLAKLEQLVTDISHMEREQWRDFGVESEADISYLNEVIFILQFQFNLLSKGPIRDDNDIQRVSAYAQSFQPLSNWCWNALGGNAFLAGNLFEAKDYLFRAYHFSKESGDGICLLSTLGCLGPALIFSGQVEQAIELSEATYTWCEQHGYDAVGLASVINRVKVLAYRELNQLDLAEHHCHKMNETQGYLDPLHRVYHCWTNILMSMQSSPEHCLEYIAQLEITFKSHFLHWNLGIPAPDLLYAILDVNKGVTKPIRLWAEKFKKHTLSEAVNSLQYAQDLMVYCRFLIETKQDPTDYLNLLYNFASATDNYLLALKSHILRIVFLWRSGNTTHLRPEAMEIIQEALDKKMYASLLDEADILAPVLKELDIEIAPLTQKLSLLEGEGRSHTVTLDETSVTSLTKREGQVLREMSRGATNEQIANELNISITTVKTHVANIYSKMHVKNRTHAISYARELGWL